YFTCSRSGVPWLQATLNGYAGRRCSSEWPGLDQRVSTFNRLLRISLPRKTGETSRVAPRPAGSAVARAAQALDDRRLVQLFAQRRQLGQRRPAPPKVVEPLRQRNVAAQRRQASIQ